VKDGSTTVTVEDGVVQVESGEHLYQLRKDQQLVVSLDTPPIGPTAVDAAEIHGWASGILPETKAEELFVRLVQGEDSSTELTGRVAFVIDTLQDARLSEVDAIRISWNPKALTNHEVSYDITVTDGAGTLLFEDRLDGEDFEKLDGHYDVHMAEPIRDVRTLVVRLIPDRSTGERQIDTFEVKAKTKIESPRSQ